MRNPNLQKIIGDYLEASDRYEMAQNRLLEALNHQDEALRDALRALDKLADGLTEAVRYERDSDD